MYIICTYDACIIFPTYIIHIKCAHDCKHMLTLRKYMKIWVSSTTASATLPAQRNPPRTNSGSRTEVQRRPMPSRTLHGPCLEVDGLRGGQFLFCFLLGDLLSQGQKRYMDVTFQQGVTTIYLTSTQVEGKPTHSMSLKQEGAEKHLTA